MPSFRADIGTVCNLAPLSAESTGNYILHRLRMAGREDSLFTEDAICRRHSCPGVPRIINSVATAARVSEAEDRVSMIDGPRVQDAAREMMLAPAVTEECAVYMTVC